MCSSDRIITAVGPDNVRLVDPIIHYVTGEGANIAEVQMYDHDEESLFAMLLRVDFPDAQIDRLRAAMNEIGSMKNLSIQIGRRRVGTASPTLAICVASRQSSPPPLLPSSRARQANP